MIDVGRSFSGKVCFLSRSGTELWARLAALAGTILLTVLPRSLCGAAENPTCVLVEKEGKVEVARKGSAAWSPADINGKLQLGDRLRTGSPRRAPPPLCALGPGSV